MADGGQNYSSRIGYGSFVPKHVEHDRPTGPLDILQAQLLQNVTPPPRDARAATLPTPGT